jgi:hypothetical protein
MCAVGDEMEDSEMTREQTLYRDVAKGKQPSSQRS